MTLFRKQSSAKTFHHKTQFFKIIKDNKNDNKKIMKAMKN